MTLKRREGGKRKNKKMTNGFNTDAGLAPSWFKEQISGRQRDWERFYAKYAGTGKEVPGVVGRAPVGEPALLRYRLLRAQKTPSGGYVMVPNVEAIKRVYGKEREAYAKQRQGEISRGAMLQQKVKSEIGRVSRLRWTPQPGEMRYGHRGFIPFTQRRKVFETFRLRKQKSIVGLQKQSEKVTRYQKAWKEATPEKVYGF